MEDESDAAVIAASLETPVRFGAIFDRHATVLLRYLVRRIGPNDADAMLGDVFRIAFERRNTYDLERAVARPWLYGIATNLVAKHRRREARRIHAVARLAAQRLPLVDEADRISGVIDATSNWQRVAHAVSELPTDEHDTLILFVWENLSYEEIADATGVPIGTVRSRLNRARRRLRELDDARGEQRDEPLDPIEHRDRHDPGRIKS